MTSKRCSVELEGDNSLTAYEVSLILEDCPADARIKTMKKINKDPVIIVWWDEDL
jgi:hypothetical protein